MDVEKMIGEDHLQAMWFAAGTAAFIACVERAVVASLFAQWRVWAFLALNLLLLAILFTSSRISPKIPSTNSQIMDVQQDSEPTNTKNSKKKIIIQEIFCSRPPVPISVEDAGEKNESGDLKMPPEIEKMNGGVDSDHQLSKEELNRRVEAFIAMFRQHLVSDAKGKSFELQFPTSPAAAARSRRLNSSSPRVSFSYHNECISA